LHFAPALAILGATLREAAALRSVVTVLTLATLVVADPPPRLVIDSGLLARLGVLAAGLHNEIVLCLSGSIDGASARATDFVMPDPKASQAERAAFGPCPAESVAIWHNHPLEQPPTLPRGDPALRPRDLCALSDTDIQTAARVGPPFIVIAVDADTWCWWSRDQVRNLAAANALHGAPVAGQLVARSPP
jgi:hypothetical protein